MQSVTASDEEFTRAANDEPPGPFLDCAVGNDHESRNLSQQARSATRNSESSAAPARRAKSVRAPCAKRPRSSSSGAAVELSGNTPAVLLEVSRRWLGTTQLSQFEHGRARTRRCVRSFSDPSSDTKSLRRLQGVLRYWRSAVSRSVCGVVWVHLTKARELCANVCKRQLVASVWLVAR